MTITSNIYVGINAWSSGSFTLGQVCSNVGNGYKCTTAGTSTAAPTGTGTNINNGGTAVFEFLSTIDFSGSNGPTVLANWEASIPSTLTQPVVGQIWFTNVPITTTTGVAFLVMSGHTTSPTNTITLTAAPGQSIFDNPQSTTPLAFNSALGVAFIQPASGVGGIDYINIQDAHVIISRLQFQDPNSNSQSTFIGMETTGPTNDWIDRCLFDGFAQSLAGGAYLINNSNVAASFNLTNCVLIDRQPANGGNQAVAIDGAGNVANTIVIAVNGGITSGNGALNFKQTSAGANSVTNSAMFGYLSPIVSLGTTVTVNNCLTDAPNFTRANVVTGTGNIFNMLPSNQYLSTTDYRLKSTSSEVDTGATDTTDIPYATDIFGTPRPQGSAWDIGPFEYVTPVATRLAGGPDNTSFGIYPCAATPGQVFKNNTAISSPSGGVAEVANDTIGLAYSNGQLWWRSTKMLAAGFTWNYSATANPATGVGGISLSGLASGVLSPLFTDLESGTCIVNTGGSTFTYTPPTGFPAYNTAAGTAGIKATSNQFQVIAANTSQLLPAGPYATSGSQIVSASTPIRLIGCYWDGGDTKNNCPNGLFAVDYKFVINNMISMGFNCVRIALNDKMIQGGAVGANAINFTIGSNPDLTALNGMQVIDKIVIYCRSVNFRVVLDRHNNEGCGGTQLNGLWYDSGGASNNTDGNGNTGTCSDSNVVADLTALATRYANFQDVVVGIGICNECKVATWGDSSNTDLQSFATRSGDAMQAAGWNGLIMVGGFYGAGMPGGGGFPQAGPLVTLTTLNRVVYEPHLYGNENDPTEWANPGVPATWITNSNTGWGWLVTTNTAPVWIGSLGASLNEITLTPNPHADTAANSLAFINTVIPYLNGQDSSSGGPDFTGNQQGIGFAWNVYGNEQTANPAGISQSWGGAAWPDQQNVINQLSPLVGSTVTTTSYTFTIPEIQVPGTYSIWVRDATNNVILGKSPTFLVAGVTHGITVSTPAAQLPSTNFQISGNLTGYSTTPSLSWGFSPTGPFTAIPASSITPTTFNATIPGQGIGAYTIYVTDGTTTGSSKSFNVRAPILISTPGSGSFTPPAGMNLYQVELLGGGQSGAGSSGSGGRSAVYVRKNNLSGMQPYTVALGGLGTTSSTPNNGQDSTFGNTLAIAPGGGSNTAAVGDVIIAGGIGGTNTGGGAGAGGPLGVGASGGAGATAAGQFGGGGGGGADGGTIGGSGSQNGGTGGSGPGGTAGGAGATGTTPAGAAGHGAGGGGGAGVGSTWDPNDLLNMTLSNSDLDATSTAAGTVFSTTSITLPITTSAIVQAELKIVAATNDFAIGFAASTFNKGSTGGLGSGTGDSFGFYPISPAQSGWIAGVDVLPPPGTPADGPGDIITIVASRAGFFIQTPAMGLGVWNNNSSANPATGVGAIAPTGLIAGTYFLAFNCLEAGSHVTANFGASSFSQAVSGAESWNTATGGSGFGTPTAGGNGNELASGAAGAGGGGGAPPTDSNLNGAAGGLYGGGGGAAATGTSGPGAQGCVIITDTTPGVPAA